MKERTFRCGATMLTALTLAGCSVDAPEEPATAPQSTDSEAQVASGGETRKPVLLDQDDLDAYSRGTPERALFDLWFAIQYRDMLTGYDLLATQFREDFAESLPHFSEFVMAEYPRWQAVPKVVFSRPAANEGRTVIVDYRRPDLGSRERFAMTFVREDGDWKLAYDFYLAQRLSAG